MNFERKVLPNGENNPKYVDLLDEDKELSGQKFVCVSFVSPEQIIKQKNMFLFDKFLKYFEFEKSVKKFHQFLNYISYKYDFNFEELMTEFSSFIDEEKDKLLDSTIEDDYKTFLERQEDKLMKEFNEQHAFQTNTRGIKIRGSFPTEEEAKLRAQMLNEKDKTHNIYVGEVGKWIPFNPDAFKTGKVVYAEEELNAIMAHKDQKEMIEKVDFDERIHSAKKEAIDRNKDMAKKTGNKLTQNMTDEGDLVDNMPDASSLLSANLKNEVLEASNISTSSFKADN
jgi:hypothetical protein